MKPAGRPGWVGSRRRQREPVRSNDRVASSAGTIEDELRGIQRFVRIGVPDIGLVEESIVDVRRLGGVRDPDDTKERLQSSRSRPRMARSFMAMRCSGEARAMRRPGIDITRHAA